MSLQRCLWGWLRFDLLLCSWREWCKLVEVHSDQHSSLQLCKNLGFCIREISQASSLEKRKSPLPCACHRRCNRRMYSNTKIPLQLGTPGRSHLPLPIFVVHLSVLVLFVEIFNNIVSNFFIAIRQYWLLCFAFRLAESAYPYSTHTDLGIVSFHRCWLWRAPVLACLHFQKMSILALYVMAFNCNLSLWCTCGNMFICTYFFYFLFF